MSSIRKRTNKDGSISYTVQIRIKRDGAIVHQESKTFSPAKYDNPSRVAQQWAKKREVELNESEPWLQKLGDTMTIGEAMLKYIDELEASPKGIGKSKRGAIRCMSVEPMLKDVPVAEADSALLMDYLKMRTSGPDGVTPSTALTDLIYYRVVMDYARIAWGAAIDLQYIDDVRKMADRMGMVAKSEQRDRRPTLEELERIFEYFDRPRAPGKHRYQAVIPMATVIKFLIFSTRRLSEVTRIEWDDLDTDNQTVLVRDMKHPRAKKGNHILVHIPDRAMDIINQMPREKGEPRIFPFESRSISRAFDRACQHRIGNVEDLRLHDLRHEGISHLFELGWDIPRVAMVSGHTTWESLKRYTHLMTTEHHDKYEGWEQLTCS